MWSSSLPLRRRRRLLGDSRWATSCNQLHWLTFCVVVTMWVPRERRAIIGKYDIWIGGVLFNVMPSCRHRLIDRVVISLAALIPFE